MLRFVEFCYAVLKFRRWVKFQRRVITPDLSRYITSSEKQVLFRGMYNEGRIPGIMFRGCKRKVTSRSCSVSRFANCPTFVPSFPFNPLTVPLLACGPFICRNIHWIKVIVREPAWLRGCTRVLRLARA